MPGRSIPVVTYHHVSPVGKVLTVPPELFEDHLRVLRRNGWKTLSGAEFLDFLHYEEIPEKCVVLTFDDGFADNYLYSYPLLRKYAMKALLFVATSFIGEGEVRRDRFAPLPHHEAWKAAFTERRSEVMCTWKELMEMEESGSFDIQSHGHSHKTPSHIKERKYQELYEDLLISKKTLEAKLSKKVFHLAWPKGIYSDKSIEIAKEVGFKALYTIERGANTHKNITMLKRLPVKWKDGEWLHKRLTIYSSVLLGKLYLMVKLNF